MSLCTALFAAWIGLCPPPQIGHLVMPAQFWLYTLEAAEANRISPYVIAGVMVIESRFDPCASSERGMCYGLMQLHRDTAKSLGVDRRDPRQNIHGGAQVLARLLKKHGGDLRAAVGAYNGKPGNGAYVREVLKAVKQAERSHP